VKRLLDYYRQFGELSPEEASARLRERSRERRARELERVGVLDLSATTWHEPPHPEVVNAATFALRRALNRYGGAREDPLREALAARHGVAPAQVVLGHGAGELLQAALVALLRGRGGEVVVPWPAWPVLPAMVRRAGGNPVSSPLGPLAAARAVTERTRAVVLCSPNDPTGEVAGLEDLRALAARLAPGGWLLLDEALADWLAPGADAARLAGELERLVVVRSFSKAHAMAGLRIGYALGSPDAERLLADLAPVQGLSAPARAGALWTTEHGEPVLERRRQAVAAEQERLLAALTGLPVAFKRTVTPFVWLRGDGLSAHLAARRITVAPGAAWGEDGHVRAAVGDPAATDRLAAALRELGAGI
jgi:histidinol-phosphate/aromatic aminotransferase/cobyric acid decarboxylase-like protein